jgi:gamma-glutamyl hercynylcysteine S-oxide synthase
MNAWQRWVSIDFSAARWPISAVAGTVFICGLWWHHAVLLGFGAVLLCITLGRATGPHGRKRWRWTRRRPQDRQASRQNSEETLLPQDPAQRPAPRPVHHSAPKTTDALVEEFLATGRYALLLRPEAKQHLSQAHIVRAIRQLDESMALVPAGKVLLGQLAEQSSSACGTTEVDWKLAQRNMVHVEPAYLDRFCVTNEEYQLFVDAGGYEQLEYWPEEALPALLDFVDQTGAPAPRYWSDGQYAAGEGRLPVVGISWYEACAYAHWVGKRLPTDAEWTKAGAWPVEAAPGRIAQRRYPWGESFDVRRAHLCGSGRPTPVAVDEFPGGISVGGVHQLIGNVWEWTDTPLVALGDPTLHVSESIISIRGGAFDTYFENQATCHYQSGEHPLSRRSNIGFRLALPMCDLEAPKEDAAHDGGVDRPVAQAANNGAAAVTCS